MRRAPQPSSLAVLLALILTAPVSAQFVQYLPPGQLLDEKLPTRESLEQGMAEARWRLGELRLDPQLWLRNLEYQDNVFASPSGSEVSDVRASAGTGLTGYLPLKADAIFSLYALPEYVWWQELEEMRRVTYRTGAGFFGYFNRFTCELSARASDIERTLNLELEVPVEIRQRGAKLAVEIDLRGPFSLFGSYGGERFEHAGEAQREIDGLDLPSLDRDEQVARLGVRYELPGGFLVGLGAEYSEAEFTGSGGARSNSGRGPLLELRHAGAHASLDASFVYRRLEFDQEPAAANLEEWTGTFRMRLVPHSKFAFVLYAARNLVYSALDSDAFFLDQRFGVGVERPVGRRVDVRLFAEGGRGEFSDVTGLDGTVVQRLDRFNSIGGGLALELGPRVRLHLQASSTDIDSNRPGGDRRRALIQGAISIGGLGRGGVPW